MPIQLTLRHSANLILIKKDLSVFGIMDDLPEKPSAKNARLRIRCSLAAAH